MTGNDALALLLAVGWGRMTGNDALALLLAVGGIGLAILEVRIVYRTRRRLLLRRGRWK